MTMMVYGGDIYGTVKGQIVSSYQQGNKSKAISLYLRRENFSIKLLNISCSKRGSVPLSKVGMMQKTFLPRVSWPLKNKSNPVRFRPLAIGSLIKCSAWWLSARIYSFNLKSSSLIIHVHKNFVP